MKTQISESLFVKFPPTPCSYDPEKDLQEVNPNGSIDLQRAYSEGVIPADVEDVDDRYNSIEADSVLGKPKDAFEYERMTKHVKDTLSKSSAAESSESKTDPSEQS